MRRRFRWVFVTLVAVVLVVLAVPVGALYARAEYRRAAGELALVATVIADLVEEDVTERRVGDVQRVVDVYAKERGLNVAVFDRGGDLLVYSSGAHEGLEGAPRPTLDDHGDVLASLQGDRVSGPSSFERRPGWMSVASPMEGGGHVVGAVDVVSPTSEVDRAIRTVWAALLLFAAVIVTVIHAIGGRLATWATRPLSALGDAAAAWGEGDLDARVGRVEGPPEVQDLAATFDRMAGRVQRLLDNSRAFAADVSHQLRLPMTSHRLRLENLEPHVAAEALGEIALLAEEVDSMVRRLDGWLLLARADGAELHSGRSSLHAVDVPVVAARTVEMVRPVTLRDGVGLELEDPPASDDAMLAWELPGALEQIVDNLLSNASKACTAGGTIQVATRREGASVVVSVSDDGPGLPESVRERAFDRFWRDEGAYRSGSGLGLAIVARLAEASGADVVLCSSAEGGLCVEVRLRAVYPGEFAEPTPPALMETVPQRS